VTIFGGGGWKGMKVLPREGVRKQTLVREKVREKEFDAPRRSSSLPTVDLLGFCVAYGRAWAWAALPFPVFFL